MTRSALFLALAFAFVLPAKAEDKIWTAVVLATNAASPKETPKELRDSLPKLKRVFGYNQFEVIGSASDKIEEGSELRLTPTQSFWLQAKARRATSKEARGGYLLSLQLLTKSGSSWTPKRASPPAARSSSAAPSMEKGRSSSR